MLYNDLTGHREDLGNMGNQRSVDCRNYPQYCNGNKPKSSEELLAFRDKDSTSQKDDCKGLECDLDKPDNKSDETVTLPIPTITPSSGPNWGKIAAGIGIIVVVDLLIVAPLAVGLTAFAPELEVAMILTEAWSWPLVGAVVAANVYGWNLIVEGAKGN